MTSVSSSCASLAPSTLSPERVTCRMTDPDNILSAMLALLTPRCCESCERISSKPDGVNNSAGTPIARYNSPTEGASEGGIGVGVSVGAGVGLHAHTACSMLPLTCAHQSASRSADRPQSRCACGPVSQSQRGPRRRCERLGDVMRGGPMIVCECVRVGMCRGLQAPSCMPVHACP